MDSNIDGIIATLSGIWAPPPKLTVSQWADQYRKLSSKSSASGGQWKTRPFQRAPMDAFTDPRVHTIVLMVARQTLKTEVINNCIGYAIDRDPGPMLVVQFRDADVKKFTKIRLDPMLEDTPVLREKVPPATSKSGENTLDFKSFPGGHLSVVASSSPGNLAALPIRYLFCDEIDKYKSSAMGVGDPISLAQGRQEEFWNRKTVLACTPTVQGDSRIEDAWELSDKREYEVPCPKCGKFQIMEWEQVKYDSTVPREKIASTAQYECKFCQTHWNDSQRWAAVRKGAFRATAPFNGVAGFRASGLCRLGTKLSAMVGEYLPALKNVEQLKVFINEQLAQLWKDPGESLDFEKLMGRAEDYHLGMVPRGVVFLTAAIDVQKNRIEMAINGWGRNHERWLVDYTVIHGDTARDEVWDKLSQAVQCSYQVASGGEMTPARFVIDSGHETMAVYRWLRSQGSKFVCIKGQNSGPLLGRAVEAEFDYNGKKVKTGVWRLPVNVDIAKDYLFGKLRQERPAAGQPYPNGYYHFPLHGWGEDMTLEEFCRQLCAEEKIKVTKKNGQTHWEWKKLRANEALDLSGYNYAIADPILRDLDLRQEWERLEIMQGVAPQVTEPSPSEAAAPITPTPAPRPIAEPEQQVAVSSSWMRNFLG